MASRAIDSRHEQLFGIVDLRLGRRHSLHNTAQSLQQMRNEINRARQALGIESLCEIGELDDRRLLGSEKLITGMRTTLGTLSDK